MNFGGTVAYISSARLPLPQLGALIAIIVQLGFGLALLAGYKTRWVALSLAIFCAATALFFHDFWSFPETQKMAMKIQFSKNMAIAGGLLAFCAFGAGRFSIDER
jgi:putative oxidoreductase